MGFPSVLRAAAVAAAVAVTPSLAQTGDDAFNTKCTAFADTLRTQFANSSIWFSTPVAAGTNLTFPDYDASCASSNPTAQVVDVDFCRVALFFPTSERSNISAEVWLPANWTGRFLSTGNGGLSGCIQYDDMAYATNLGFSTVATNNGHNGTRGTAFYNNDDVVEDFAYRALHTGVLLGKDISKAFYGEEHNKSYYLGCSTGGRQGFKEAQDFPDSFDGLVVGAPALAFNNLSSWSGYFFTQTGTQNSSTFVPFDLWPVVHQDILDQCDALDAYVDGIIEDASSCKYNLSSSLVCSSPDVANATACLTDAQANTVRNIFKDVINDIDGSLVYPAMQPGSELEAEFVYYSGSPFIYTSDWYQFAIYNDPSWDPATLSSQDMSFAAAKNPFNIETWKGDLSAVRDRGSKILHYHGQQDPIITSLNSPRYYENVASTMGQTPAQLDDFYRFFRISGMSHCAGGPGASFIGQKVESTASLDPDQNVLMAMVRWVEEGVAPDTITGTAYVNGDQSTGEVAFTRRHCRYPTRNVYSGSGDPTSPDSWTCV